MFFFILARMHYFDKKATKRIWLIFCSCSKVNYQTFIFNFLNNTNPPHRYNNKKHNNNNKKLIMIILIIIRGSQPIIFGTPIDFDFYRASQKLKIYTILSIFNIAYFLHKNKMAKSDMVNFTMIFKSIVYSLNFELN